MKRPVCKTTVTRFHGRRRPAGYTMVEILVATALMLTILLAVAWVFGMVGETIADSRSTLEMSGQLRAATTLLEQDLGGVTVTMLPPRDPSSDEGYFEITEGAIGPVISGQVHNASAPSFYQPYGVARNNDRLRQPPPTANDPDQVPYEVDTTVGDIDDILSLTTRSNGEPFIGSCVQKRAPLAGETALGVDDYDGDGTRDNPYTYNQGTIQSDLAEVIYFVRSGTLYRRVLLIKPDFPKSTPWQGNMELRNDPTLPAPPTIESIHQLARQGFYNNDVSVRLQLRNVSQNPVKWTYVLAANTLGDLTKRENRYAHRAMIPFGPRAGNAAGFPFHPHWWCSGNPADDGINQIVASLNPTHWGTHYKPIPITNSPTLLSFPLPAAPYEVYTGLGLPTLGECSHPDWAAGETVRGLVNTALTASPSLPLTPLTPSSVYDAWSNPCPYQEQDPSTGNLFYNPAVFPPLDRADGFTVEPPLYMGPRTGEDVVLTNVIGFDVKVWDPGALLLPGIDAMGTPTDLTLTGFENTNEFLDDVPLVGVALAPGDLGYRLAWAHYTHSGAAFQPVGMGAYVDLGHGFGTSAFATDGDRRSQLKRVYDTWSTHYESNWFDRNLNGDKDSADVWDDVSSVEYPGNENRTFSVAGDPTSAPIIDEGTDGVDNPGNGLDDDNNGTVDDNDDFGDGVVDDGREQEAPAPYPVALRGIQIKIRVFDPDSRQVRERTIVHDFLPK